MRYTKELRWKVCRRVHNDDLQTRLNKLTRDGWSIHDIIGHSFMMFSIVATRVVMKRDPKGQRAHR